jgi:hypothetical protein
MIISTTILISLPTIGLGIAAQASRIPHILSANLIWDRVQVTIFCLQEAIISILYIVETRRVLLNRSILGQDDKKSLLRHRPPPFAPSVILGRFKSNKLTNSGSNTAVLSASDWRKTGRLLRKVATEVDCARDARAKQLSHIIHAMSVKVQLLEHENKQPQDAFENGKKRRQRGKPLLLKPS